MYIVINISDFFLPRTVQHSALHRIHMDGQGYCTFYLINICASKLIVSDIFWMCLDFYTKYFCCIENQHMTQRPEHVSICINIDLIKNDHCNQFDLETFREPFDFILPFP